MQGTHVCPRCRRLLTPGQQFAFKLILGAGGLSSGALTKNPVAGLAIAIASLLIGHLLDEELAKRCPECSAVLVLASAAI